MQQLDMFGSAQAEVSIVPTPESIRARLVAVLDQLRSTDEMPWSPSEARGWSTVVPQMTNWLPETEAADVRNEFASLMAKFDQAA